MKTLLISALNVVAFLSAICMNLPSAERGAGKLALSTGHYKLAVQLYSDALHREFARCVQA